MKSVVIPIKPSEAYPWLLLKHYAKRLCPISYAFGIYFDGILSGVVTYGVPASSSLRSGICGPDHAKKVLELNRLCCLPIKNAPSSLIGRSLKMLPRPSIIVSYADEAQGHNGYIYQASNFIYTGLSAKRTDWKIKGMEHLHGATVADMSRGVENRAQYMRETYGDNFYLSERSRKHRYIYFLGSKTEIKNMKKALNYDVKLYPKKPSKRYDDGGTVSTQKAMFIDV